MPYSLPMEDVEGRPKPITVSWKESGGGGGPEAGIVMVPCLLLSAAFFSTAVWGDVPGENQSLALGLGGLLLAAGLLALLIPSTNPETKEDETDPST